MTKAERAKPNLINGSRRERIANGAGVQVYDVNQLLKQFAETRKLMKQFQSASGKGKRRMRIPGLPGGF
jgi:signal recognition particle subunit SRP54